MLLLLGNVGPFGIIRSSFLFIDHAGGLFFLLYAITFFVTVQAFDWKKVDSGSQPGFM